MKILMITSSLKTGGAETHIASLSRTLRAAGHTVVLASSGGAAAEQLSREGFAHYVMPLGSRKPSELFRAYRMLCDFLRRERFDVVHAHARIPAYLVGRVKRHLGNDAGFRFAVTCHAAFRVTPLYRRLSDWGDGTIAVSEDLRTYLCDSYDLNPDRVTVIPNGIDCDHFSPENEREACLPGGDVRQNDVPGTGTGRPTGTAGRLDFLMETAEEVPVVSATESNPSPEDTVTQMTHTATERPPREILFLSRLDDDCSLAAETLIRLAPRIRASFPTTGIFVAGGGEAYPRLAPLAKENGVTMLGELADPLPAVRRCDLFVGVSRAAMEAAAVGKTVILAGNEGYLGVLDDGTRASAEATNYTCRGCGTPSAIGEDGYAERLFYDLSTLLAAPEEVLLSLGERNRSTMREHHSVYGSAAATLAFYETLPPPLSGKYLLFGGYFGYGNTGDDAVAEALIARIRKTHPGFPVAFLSRQPERDAKRYAAPCFSRTSPLEIHRAMKGASAYLMGGGSLLQNLTSERSLSYYLALLKTANRRGIPTVMFSGGIGPLRGTGASRRVAKELERAAYVSVRDGRSAGYLAGLGIPEDRIYQGADPAFLLAPADPDRIAVLLKRFRIDRENGRYLAVAAGAAGEYERAKLAVLVSEVCRRNRLTPLYFPLFPAKDAETAREIAASVGFGGRVLPGLSPRETLGILPYCAAALSVRLHLLVFAVSAGIPAVGIGGSDPKIGAFAELAGLPEAVTLPAVSPEKIAALFGKLLERREEICDNIKNAREGLVHSAEEDLDRVLSLVLH